MMVLPEVVWTHPALPKILTFIPLNVRSLLDLGCGRGIIGALCRIYRNPRRLVGVDIFDPYLEFCRKYSFYDEVIKWDLNILPLPFKDGEFDVVTAIEVIEHLPKKSGEKLLTEMERIACKRVIVSTPNVFFQQKNYDKNEYQIHKSLWTWRDFVSRGYKTYGVGKFILLGRRIRWLSFYLANITWKFPQFSSLILCIKDLE